MRVIDLNKYKTKVESVKPKAEPVVATKAVVVKAQDVAPRQDTKAQLLAQLDEQTLAVRRDRNKVSNRARERWKAGADETELASLYVTINAFTDELKKLWDKRDHVERFGSLPLEVRAQDLAPRQESAEVALLKLEKKKLEEKKSKLRAKLKPNAKAPYNGARKLLWEAELDEVEAHWKELFERIKKMQYDARSANGG